MSFLVFYPDTLVLANSLGTEQFAQEAVPMGPDDRDDFVEAIYQTFVVDPR
jgi:hypothetical protein